MAERIKPKPEAKEIRVKTICNIKQICKEKELSIYALAGTMNMHPNQIYAYTSNKVLPNLITALLIAKTLNVSVDDLWTITIKKI